MGRIIQGGRQLTPSNRIPIVEKKKMALKLKSINWQKSKLPPKVNGNLLFVSKELIGSKWSIVQYEPLTYKLIITNGECQMSIYLSTMTVQTALNHPKAGKTQLTRKGITITEFRKLLSNPRTHTNKGYHTLN